MLSASVFSAPVPAVVPATASRVAANSSRSSSRLRAETNRPHMFPSLFPCWLAPELMSGGVEWDLLIHLSVRLQLLSHKTQTPNAQLGPDRQAAAADSLKAMDTGRWLAPTAD